MSAQEFQRQPEYYSKTEVDLKLQVVTQPLDAKIEKVDHKVELVMSKVSSIEKFLYAGILPVLLAVLAIVVNIAYKIH